MNISDSDTLTKKFAKCVSRSRLYCANSIGRAYCSLPYGKHKTISSTLNEIMCVAFKSFLEVQPNILQNN